MDAGPVDESWYAPAPYATESADRQRRGASTIAPLKIDDFRTGSSSSIHQRHHYSSIPQHDADDPRGQLVLSSLADDESLIDQDYSSEYTTNPQQQQQQLSTQSQEYIQDHHHGHHDHHHQQQQQQPSQVHHRQHHGTNITAGNQLQRTSTSAVSHRAVPSAQRSLLVQKYWPQQKLINSPAALSRLNQRLGGHIAPGPLRAIGGSSSANAGSASTGAIDKKTCPVCFRRFRDGYDVRVHMRSHTRERPFPCPHCDYRASTKGSLKAHLLNKHSLH
ncbi:homeotic protein spalt-major-like [Varroa jacobsoni]|uniref:homeotic protein spalt-major-like n=1 Tax=Varroa jacobsoni TaxID=62625 RepID=UPI000BF8AEDB|nr:homeotic protein spalt-major-like [Varroa jacobsoni]